MLDCYDALRISKGDREKNDGIILRNLSKNTSVILGEDKDSFIDCGIAFSKDGRSVAIAYQKGNIIVWDLNGKKITEFLTQFPSQKMELEVRVCPSLFFSPDGKQLAIGESSVNSVDVPIIEGIHNLNLWDLSGNKPIKKQPFQDFQYEGYGFNSNNQLVVAHKGKGERDDLWDLSDFVSGNKITTINVDSGIAYRGTNLIFSPDDSKLIMLDYFQDLSNLNTYIGEEDKISAINFSPDGQKLVQTNEDGTIEIKSIKNLPYEDPSKIILKGHDGSVFKIVFSPDGKQLVSLGRDGTLRLWDLSEKSLASVQNLPSQTSQIKSARNSRRNKNIEVTWQSLKYGDEGGQGGSFYVRDKSGKLLFKTESKFILDSKTFNFNPDGTLFVVVDFQNVTIWDFSGRLLFESEIDKADYFEQTGKIKSKFSDDGSLLVIEKCSDSDKCTPFKYLQLETFDELIIRGCDLVRDYLQNNPNVSESDRHLCDNVPVLVTSQISTTPPPYPSTLIPEDFSPALQAIAEDYYTRGSEQPANKLIAKYTEIIENSDSNNADTIADAYINRGVIYFRQRKYDLAIQDYTEVINRIAPKKAAAYVNRGIAYSTQQDHQKAIADYNEAIKIEPKNVDAYINRGIAYSSTGNHQSAIEDYRKAIEINPDDADAYYAMGFTQTLMEGKRQEAIENYQKATDLYQRQNKPKYAENARKKIEELSASQ